MATSLRWRHEVPGTAPSWSGRGCSCLAGQTRRCGQPSRWYGQLRDLENRLAAQPQGAAEVVRELNALDERVGRITVPLAYAEELYALRNNIDSVRRKALQGAT